MNAALLPAEFEDLTQFSGWILPTEVDRNAMRLSSSMDDIRALYDAVLSQAEAIFGYLNGFELDNMPAEARNLLYLTLSLIEVAPAVEYYGEPHIPNGYDMTRIINPEGERFRVP